MNFFGEKFLNILIYINNIFGEGLLITILALLIALLIYLQKIHHPKGIRIQKVKTFLKNFSKQKNNVQEFKKYNNKKSSYINRDSNKKLSEYLINKNFIANDDKGILLSGISMMGKTTMFYNELFRNIKKLKNHYLFIPERDLSLNEWNRKLPWWIFTKKIIVFLDDLNLYKDIKKHTFSEILNCLNRRHNIKLTGTCRVEDEWESVSEEFSEFFRNITLEKITDEQAEDLAKKENKDLLNFDKTPGSIILNIERQKRRINNLRENNKICYDLLKSSAILYKFLIQRTYKKELILNICEFVLNNPDVKKKYYDCVEDLGNNKIVYKINNEISELDIPDSYLDYFNDILESDKNNLINLLSEFSKTKNGKIIIQDLAGYIYNMGNDYNKIGDFDKAIECYKKAVEIKPDYHEALYNMGNAYKKKGDFDKAIECYEKAIKIKPDYHKAFYNIGIAYDEKEDFDKAIECYKKAVEIKPDYHEALFNMGNAYDEIGEFDKAIECYEKSIKIKPDDYKALFNMGFVYEFNKDYDNAKKCFKKYEEIMISKDLEITSTVKKHLEDFYKIHK